MDWIAFVEDLQVLDCRILEQQTFTKFKLNCVLKVNLRNDSGMKCVWERHGECDQLMRDFKHEMHLRETWRV